MALLTTGFMAGCVTSEESRINAAAALAANANRTGQAIAAAENRPVAPFPALPADCRKHERIGLKKGERQDAALVKADAAITRGNSRIDRCAGFYDDTAATFNAGLM